VVSGWPRCVVEKSVSSTWSVGGLGAQQRQVWEEGVVGGWSWCVLELSVELARGRLVAV